MGDDFRHHRRTGRQCVYKRTRLGKERQEEHAQRMENVRHKDAEGDEKITNAIACLMGMWRGGVVFWQPDQAAGLLSLPPATKTTPRGACRKRKFLWCCDNYNSILLLVKSARRALS